jgi:dihydroorotase
VQSPKYLLRNGRIVDPASGMDETGDVLVSGGVVERLDSSIEHADAQTVDCTGCVIAPGLVDLHAHLRVPGFEYKEKLETGTASAAAGGFTGVCCMPNTNPPLDSVEAIADLQRRIAGEASVRVYPVATISRQRAGREPVDYDALAKAGAVGFSDDGDSTLDENVMREALRASTRLNRPVMVHCEDPDLVGGVMHEGVVSRRLGVRGLPAAAEENYLARDIRLAEETGGWLYALHVSTGRGADMVRQARRRGARVSAEVMPHHLLMTDRWLAGERVFALVDEPAGTPVPAPFSLAKVNPPLRTEADARALLEAVSDGTFDVVATDHAPHAMTEKPEGTLDGAAFGMSGFEVALPLMLSLVRANLLSMTTLVDLMSRRPAELLGLPGGRLAAGAVADIVVFDPDRSWRVEADVLATKSPNTPLLGMTVRGKAVATLVGGRLAYAAEPPSPGV